MPGVPDPLYLRARAAMLYTVEALSSYRNDLVLVGVQAVYFHTGDTAPAVAEYTTDADFTVRWPTLPTLLYWPTSSGHEAHPWRSSASAMAKSARPMRLRRHGRASDPHSGSGTRSQPRTRWHRSRAR